MKIRHTFSLAALALAPLVALTSTAAEIAVVSPPNAMLIVEPGAGQQPPANKELSEWRIAQWNTPQALGALKQASGEHGCEFETSSPAMSVKVQTPVPCGATGGRRRLPGSETASFQITQQDAGMQCELEGKPREFDGFVAPHSALRRPAMKTPLGSLLGIRHTLEFRLDDARLARDSTCTVNQLASITALVFSNRSMHQTLFYQLKLVQEGGRGAGTPYWWATGKRGIGNFESEGDHMRFGFGDRLSSFGVRDPAPGAVLRLDLELLPRVRAIIAEGRQHGMDQDLGHWQLSGAYIGNTFWGRGSISTHWTGYAIHLRKPDGPAAEAEPQDEP